MEKKETINVEVKVQDIRKMLLNRIVTPDALTIVDVIIDNLSITPKGLSQVYMAMNGIKPSTKFKIGDDVLLDFRYMYTWDKCMDCINDSNHVFQGFIKAKIIDINLQKDLCIFIEYDTYFKDKTIHTFKEEYRENVIFLDESGLLED